MSKEHVSIDISPKDSSISKIEISPKGKGEVIRKKTKLQKKLKVLNKKMKSMLNYMT